MSLEFITVPNLGSVEFLKRLRSSIDLSYMDPEVERKILLQGATGSGAYEALTWTPEIKISNVEVLEYFFQRGFEGNRNAYLFWLMRHNPLGWQVSIPKITEFKNDFDAGTLYYYHNENSRWLTLCSIRHKWRSNWTYVGFRKLRNAPVQPQPLSL